MTSRLKPAPKRELRVDADLHVDERLRVVSTFGCTNFDNQSHDTPPHERGPRIADRLANAHVSRSLKANGSGKRRHDAVTLRDGRATVKLGFETRRSSSRFRSANFDRNRARDGR